MCCVRHFYNHNNPNMNDIKITLSDLSIDEVNAILAGLQELPGKICNPMSQKIRQQAEAQLPKQEPSMQDLATPAE
jgi:hypothetical protein